MGHMNMTRSSTSVQPQQEPKPPVRKITEKPSLCSAILAWFCCYIFGTFALVYRTRSSEAAKHKDLERQEFFAKKTWKCNIIAYVFGLAAGVTMVVMLVQTSSTTVYYCNNYIDFC